MEYYLLVFPLQLNDNDMSLLHPFTPGVWICSLIFTPIMIIAMGSLDFIHYKKVKWLSIIDFVLRSAVFQHGQRLNDEENYQRILTISWLCSATVITFAYAGNLMAMITRPSISLPISNVDDLLKQDDISWVVEPGIGIVDYMNDSPPGSKMKRLIDRAILLDTTVDWANACYDVESFKAGTFASICDLVSIKALIHDDFSDDAKCNFYYMEDFLSVVPSVMAIQVNYAKVLMK